MLRRIGYACLCLSVPDSNPRGTILRNATPDRLRALIEENLRRTEAVLRFNIDHGIRLFRLSSDLIPFGSHPVNTVPWWAPDEFGPRLAELGRLIASADMRVSFHPGQYTVLSSPEPRVLEAARQDLLFHTRLLTTLGLDASHKIVIHGGGAYGDKAAASQRWVSTWHDLLDEVRARLVIENDERIYDLDDVLSISAATDGRLPVVFDVFHYRVAGGQARDLPSALRRAFATWHPARDGIPKIHFSSQAANQRPGAHADWIDPAEFAQFLASVPHDLGPFDCMLEAKSKDQALFQLREALQLTA